ncbi:MAG: sporulation protein [Bacteroidota bacterium]
MIGKVKQWLGIEGVKLELDIPEGQALANGSISGNIRLHSMNPQTVTGIRVVLIERYGRGRGEERLIDEYELGSMELKETFEVAPDSPVQKPFHLTFEALESDVDRWGNRNMLNRQFAKAARWVRKAQSQYRVEAEAKVKGVALNPFDKKTVELI